MIEKVFATELTDWVTSEDSGKYKDVFSLCDAEIIIGILEKKNRRMLWDKNSKLVYVSYDKDGLESDIYRPKDAYDLAFFAMEEADRTAREVKLHGMCGTQQEYDKVFSDIQAIEEIWSKLNDIFWKHKKVKQENAEYNSIAL